MKTRVLSITLQIPIALHLFLETYGLIFGVWVFVSRDFSAHPCTNLIMRCACIAKFEKCKPHYYYYYYTASASTLK